MEPTSQQPASTDSDEAQNKPVDTMTEPATDMPSMASEPDSSAAPSSEGPSEPLLSSPTIKSADETSASESLDTAPSAAPTETPESTEDLSIEDLKPASDATSSSEANTSLDSSSSTSATEDMPSMASEPEPQSTPSSFEETSAPLTGMSSDDGDLMKTDGIDNMPAPTPPMPASSPSDAHKKSPMLMWLVFVIALIIVAVVAALAAYQWGHKRGYTSGQAAGQASMTQQTEKSAVTVPSNATIVSSCTPGEGIQYAIPKDLPGGPFYNVWQNKVVGMEYMVGQTSLSKNPISNLQTYGTAVNHIDVMYEAAGHAGFSEPHYHINLSMISYADEAKITCGAASSSMGMH